MRTAIPEPGGPAAGEVGPGWQTSGAGVGGPVLPELRRGDGGPGSAMSGADEARPKRAASGAEVLGPVGRRFYTLTVAFDKECASGLQGSTVSGRSAQDPILEFQLALLILDMRTLVLTPTR